MKVSEVAITNEKDLYISIWRDFQNILLSGSQQSDKDYPVDLRVGKKGIKNIHVSVCYLLTCGKQQDKHRKDKSDLRRTVSSEE